ncbi:MAG: hypothetical protein VKP70_09660 [Cyanobacteriota bacterium]|nr:hypothetical protein [Cyanobacteriota bacterium]
MVIRTAVFSLALASSLLTALPPGVRAQSDGSSTLRAANMARMKAENLNGGLGVYRPAACMYSQGGGSCLVKSSREGYLFRFPGGGPGWQQLGNPATVETEILVAPDGRSILQVIYNGPPRGTTTPPGTGSGNP